MVSTDIKKFQLSHVCPGTSTTTTTTSASTTTTQPQVGGNITVRLDVDKEIVGNRQPAENTKFIVNVLCEGATVVDQDLTFTYSTGLGVQSIIRQIPSGTLTCTVTETDTGGSLLDGYKVNAGDLQDGATVDLDGVHPSATVTVVNDPSGGIQVAGTSVTGALALTGSESGTLLKSAAALVGIGVAALLVTRRRRRATLLG